MKVIKRDGRVVVFDEKKIENAILKAFNEVDGEINNNAKLIAKRISISVKKIDRELNVEEIQDIVEEYLMATRRKDVAKAYILYRDERSRVRESNSEIIKNVLKRTDAKVIENSNANVDENSFSGREKEASAEIQKYIALESDFGLDKVVAQAHKDMLVYQHDLEKAPLGIHNCLQENLTQLLTKGFTTRNGGVRPPSSFSTACQLVAVAFQCQSQVQFGGVGTIHLDYDLAPFVKKSFIKKYVLAIVKNSEDFITLNLMNMNEEDLDNWITENTDKYLKSVGLVKDDVFIDNKENLNQSFYQSALLDLMLEGRQSAQGLYHNLNTLESRQGSQVPFTSINMGRDTSTEGRLVTKWMLNASIDGIGKYHLTSIFPISILQYKKGVNANPDDPNYDLKQLALQSLSKRIYPNFVNCDWSEANEVEGDIDTYMATMGK